MPYMDPWGTVFGNTRPKTNMEPENHPIEKDTDLPTSIFQFKMLVFGGVSTMASQPTPM